MPIRDFPIPHIPDKLPITSVTKQLLTSSEFIKQAVAGQSSLSKFIGYLQNIPNPDILISALTMQEAVLSSKIEGTIATIEDVINNTPTTDVIKNDIKEIENYVAAIQFAFSEFKEKHTTITKNMICSLHQILLSENPLYLFLKGAITFPVFYISRYFVNNDAMYKECLHRISQSKVDSREYIDAWRDWIIFFLQGVQDESIAHISAATSIINLYKEMIEQVKKTEHIQIIDYIFDKLRVTPIEVIENTQLNRTAVYSTLKLLTEKGYLSRVGSERKSKYIFSSLVNILS